MAIKDVLLALTSYPDPAPDASIDRALAFCAQFDAQVTGLAFETELKLTKPTNFLTRMLVDVPAMAAEESAKSRAHSAHLKSYFQASATRQRVRHTARIETSEIFGMPAALAEEAKLHDLTILPMQNVYGVEQWHAETTIFGSGRPVLVLPGPDRMKQDSMLSSITLAWDFSRPAARALADTMPLLRTAGRVRVVLIENEKELPSRRSMEGLAQHLTAHGVASEMEMVDAQGRAAADVLREHLRAREASMLVMGAYGHSRVREFVLGGTTRSMLDDPPLPVFLSH